MASGKALGAFALTEPGSGSDIGGMDTVARRDGDAWVVSGSKTFISNAADAETTVLFAKTDPAAGFRGISAFVLSRGAPGVSYSEPQDKLGIRSAPTHTVYLDGARITDDRVIGELGSGGKMALSALNRARIDIAAMANGVAQRALELAVEYATARVQFGHPIRDFQAIQLMLGEMDAQLEAARLTAWWAAAEKDSGADLRRAGSIAKWVATESCCAIVDKAVQVHGGAGYMRESEIERLYRDARILRIFEGTSQIQLLGIAATLATAFDRNGEVV
jgi:acyl-CoA dehydrogenase